ncbi:MAG: GNAT family N-acetyltransferase [Patescibacteria group bacterium]|jgi:amino-acid N-acetyltransferase
MEQSQKEYSIRPAGLADCKAMAEMINFHAKEGIMLPKSAGEIMLTIATYFTAVSEGAVVGVCGYKIWIDGGVEIRSLVVSPDFQGRGLGTALVKKCVDEAKAKGFTRFIALTVQPRVFKKLGFRELKKEDLPAKFWTECRKCSRFSEDKCAETAFELVL